jgi:hypothetical protein
MKTDDLITLLARGESAVEPPRDGVRLAWSAALVLPLLVAVVALAEGLVPPALWGQSATLWKAGYALSLAGAAVWLFRRAGRPGMGLSGPVAMVAILLGAAALIGLQDWLRAPPGMQMGKLVGHSALFCPAAILIMSLPMLGAALWAARGLAPLRPGLAGAAAGMMAGGLAALAYGLACTEGALVFVAVWYSLGMLLATALGALAGRFLLRW